MVYCSGTLYEWHMDYHKHTAKWTKSRLIIHIANVLVNMVKDSHELLCSELTIFKIS